MPISVYIREQPAALDRCVEAARVFATRWTPGEFDSIALVGSGSSFNAHHVARPRFVAARRGPVLVFDPQDFIDELPELGSSRPLVVVLSQSGASASSIAAAKTAVDAGLPTLAISATERSLFALSGAQMLILPVGNEPVGPKTKGFVGSLAMLFVLAEALGAPRSTAMTSEVLSPLVHQCRGAAEKLVVQLADVDAIVIAGRRANHGIALEASLKIAEMSGVPCAAFPTEELLHGRLHGLTPRSTAFLLAEGDGEMAEAHRAAAAMPRRDCRLLVVDAQCARPADVQSPIAAPWNTIGLIVLFQWLAVLLADARGLKPETMRHGGLSAELAIKTDARP
jgi:glucosamine--fructose-6-phosphate aminotransferase (isomerizing)